MNSFKSQYDLINTWMELTLKGSIFFSRTFGLQLESSSENKHVFYTESRNNNLEGNLVKLTGRISGENVKDILERICVIRN